MPVAYWLHGRIIYILYINGVKLHFSIYIYLQLFSFQIVSLLYWRQSEAAQSLALVFYSSVQVKQDLLLFDED